MAPIRRFGAQRRVEKGFLSPARAAGAATDKADVASALHKDVCDNPAVDGAWKTRADFDYFRVRVAMGAVCGSEHHVLLTTSGCVWPWGRCVVASTMWC